MFTYLMPTKIIAGENSVAKNKDALILGAKAMIVTGKSSGAKSGALGDVTAALEKAGLTVTEVRAMEDWRSITAKRRTLV